MRQYIEMWRRGLDFTGKASFSEFWLAFLFNILIAATLFAISSILKIQIPSLYVFTNHPLLDFYNIISLIPLISLWIRRLHGVGKSGWWMIAILIPFVGLAILLYFAYKEGDQKVARIAKTDR